MSFVSSTVGNLLEEQVKYYPNNEAIVYPELNIRYTYKQFDQLVNQAAQGLLSIGIKKGENVAIWSDNKLEWLITQFATAKIGAVLVTVNTNYQAFELEYLLKQSDCTTLIMAETNKHTSYVDVLHKICPALLQSRKGNLQCEKLPYLSNIIIISDEERMYAYNYSEIINRANLVTESDLIAIKSSLDPHDVINMQYTSGTTGFPKGVMLSHFNIVNNAVQIGNQMRLTKKDRICIPVPFFHTFGCVLGILTAVAKGSTMVILEQFQAESVLKAVAKEKCTVLHGVPTMFIAELNNLNFDMYDLSSLRTGIMAGSTCPIEVMRDVMTKMGASEITIAYGLTESSPVITQTNVNDPIELKVRTVGQALPNIEVKIVDPNTYEELPPNEQGELLTRGYHVMKGYYKNERATKEAIDESGWLRTGDLATVDNNGYFTITGRMTDVIIRGGENIYPREIEEFLYSHPHILDAQVIGIPCKTYGEEMMACIILKEEVHVTEEEIHEFCLNNISWHKIPKYVQFVERFPMTASGKIQKFKLRELAMKQMNI